VAAVAEHVRRLGGGIRPEPDPRPARWVRGDPEEGERLFTMNCALCHGPKGEGGEGPALRNRVLLNAATDTYLMETIKRGRRDTTMASFAVPTTIRRALDDHEIESIVVFLRIGESQYD